MASTIAFYTGDGTTTDFTVPFDYLAKKFVRVSLGVTILKGGDYGDTSKDYYFLDKTKVRLKVPPASGEVLTIRRYTSATDRVVSFKDASVLKATDLDVSSVQTIHIAEESRDIINDALIKDKEGNWDAKSNRIVNVGNPEADSDAVTYGVYKADALGAYQAKLDADRARDRAVEAETNSKKSEANSKLSEENAQASADTAVSASEHADALKVENQAILQEAKEIRDENKVLDTNTKNNANVAQVKANEAKVSETNAKASEVEAKKQADLAKGYANQAASGQVNADWNETMSTSKAFIKNKPTLGALASKDSIAYSEITGTPPAQDLSGLATKDELQTGLAGKSPTGHTHTIANVTNLQTSLDAKASSADLSSLEAEVTKDLQAVNTALAGKSNTKHTHTVSQITDMPNVVLSVNGQAPNDDGNISPSQTGCLPLTGGTLTGGVGHSILDISETSGTVTLTANRIHKMNISGNTTFSLPAGNASVFTQIKVMVNVTGTPSINWGTSRFFNKKVPSIAEGQYDFYFDYDPTANAWVAGAVPKGVA